MMNFKRGTVFKTFVGLLTAGALLIPNSSYAADVDADGIGDESDGVPCDPRASSVTFAPAKDQQGSLVFEDKWPAQGDLDFNDVALSYNYIFFLDDAGRVSSMQASINLLAAGGSIANSVRLHLPVAADAAATIELNGSDGVIHAVTPEAHEHELVVSLIPDVHAAMGDTQANSTTSKPSVPGVPLNLYIKFQNPVELDLTQAPFDLYIERVQEPGHQIHQVGYAGTDTMDSSLFGGEDDGSTADRHFVDKDGLPFALSVPAAFQWPREETSISTAYPDITAWATSGGAAHADWYQTNVAAASVWSGGADGSLRPIGVVLGPTDPSEDVQCAPWKGTLEFGESPNLYPNAVATDRAGSVIVTGYQDGDNGRTAFVTKYDSHKKALWTKAFASSTPFSAYSFAEGYGVASDSENNLYLVGYVLGSIAGEAFNQTNARNGFGEPFVTKLDSNGNLAWVIHPSLTGTMLYATGITVGPDGAIDVVGNTREQSAFIAQLDASGRVFSLKRPQLANAQPKSIAVDPGGNMYVSGSTTLPTYRSGTLVAKYSPTGDLLWRHVDDHSVFSTSERGQLAVDAQGNAYVSGYRQVGQECYSSCDPVCTLGTDYCCFKYCNPTYDAPLWKFDTNGQQRWETSIGKDNYAFATTIDAKGNPYYGGYSWVSAGGQSTLYKDFVAKVNPETGAVVWLRQTGTDITMATCMATDPAGSVFVSGLTNTDSDGNPLAWYQPYVSKYDSNGNKQ